MRKTIISIAAASPWPKRCITGRDYAPGFFPLPHPSPRNLRWFRDHPGFEQAVLPVLRRRLASRLQ